MGLWPLGKKKKDNEEGEEVSAAGDAGVTEPEVQVAEATPAASGRSGGGGDIELQRQVGKISADVEKLKAQLGTFMEMQKSSSERFGMINQQIGELRTMLIERDKAGQTVEAKASQAIDLVKTVQPDKLMVELKKNDNKLEALKASLESNESITNNIISDLKNVKEKIQVFRGMEQVIKLNEDSKEQLKDIKKSQSVIERHSDKIETIFSEMQKKAAEFAKVSDMVFDLDRSFKQLSSDLDSIKVKIKTFGAKKEMDTLVAKFDDFEKYVGSVVKLVDNNFKKQRKEFDDLFKVKFSDMDKLIAGFKLLAEKTPDLDKYFHLIEDQVKKAEAKAAASGKKEGGEPEKIKEVGGDDKRLETGEKKGGGLMDSFNVLKEKFKKK